MSANKECDAIFPSEAGHSGKLTSDMKHFSYPAALDNVNTMNRELQALQDKYLELGVRTHLLEVDLATQFSPDTALGLDRLNHSRETCKAAVKDLVVYSHDICTLQPAETENEHQRHTCDRPTDPTDQYVKEKDERSKCSHHTGEDDMHKRDVNLTEEKDEQDVQANHTEEDTVQERGPNFAEQHVGKKVTGI